MQRVQPTIARWHQSRNWVGWACERINVVCAAVVVVLFVFIKWAVWKGRIPYSPSGNVFCNGLVDNSARLTLVVIITGLASTVLRWRASGVWVWANMTVAVACTLLEPSFGMA